MDASQAEDAILAEEVVRDRIQKEEVQQVVVDPKVDDGAFRVEAAEDTDNNDEHNMHQGDCREREEPPQQHWHWDLLQRYLPFQRQPPPQ